MASAWFTRQNLGVFSADLPRLVSSLDRVDFNGRTHVGRYTLLDLSEDPPFPSSGTFKKVYYCVSRALGSGEFTLYIAAGSRLECPIYKREKKILSLLSGVKGVLHPQAYEKLGDDEYMISELFNQGELYSYILDPRRVTRSFDSHWIGYCLVEAVQACHERGVVLRDLKPENALVRQLEDGSHEVKLIDFGLAFLIGEDDEKESFRTCGSPLYLSPSNWAEMKKRGRALPATFERDLWPLGSILYSMELKDAAAKEIISSTGKVIGIQTHPMYKIYLGIYDPEIRNLLFATESERLVLHEIRKRMLNTLFRLYPNVPSVRALNPAPRMEMEDDTSFLEPLLLSSKESYVHESEKTKTIWQRICCCL